MSAWVLNTVHDEQFVYVRNAGKDLEESRQFYISGEKLVCKLKTKKSL